MSHLEDLPGWCNTVVGDMLSELTHLDTRITQYDKHIAQTAKEDTQASQLMRLDGVGPTSEKKPKSNPVVNRCVIHNDGFLFDKSGEVLVMM